MRNITLDIYHTQSDKRSALYRWMDEDNGRILIQDGRWFVEYYCADSRRLSEKAHEQLKEIVERYYNVVEL